MSATIRLHSRLYRARAVREAVRAVQAGFDGVFERGREGDYHVVTASGSDPERAREALAEVADAALVLTVEADGT